MGRLKDFPVGGIVLRSGVIMGTVKVPCMRPTPRVHSPLAILTEWTLMRLSGRIEEEGFHVRDMFIDAVGGVAVWPIDGNVFGMALLEAVPLLAGEDVEVEGVEGCLGLAWR